MGKWFSLNHDEFTHLAIITLVLGFCFGFRWTDTELNQLIWFQNWGYNFIAVLILTAISITISQLVLRWYAHKHEAKVKINVWWLGVIIALLAIFLTRGYFIFAAIMMLSISTSRILRPGRNYPKYHAGPYDAAKIAAMVPLANFGLAIIGKVFQPFSETATKFMIINLWLAVFGLLPCFTIIALAFAGYSKEMGVQRKDALPGDNIFFGSRPLWVFLFIFFLVSAFLFVYSDFLIGLIGAFAIAFAIYLLWFYYIET